MYHIEPQCVTACHDVSQCITVCPSVSQCIAVHHNVSQCVTLYHSVFIQHRLLVAGRDFFHINFVDVLHVSHCQENPLIMTLVSIYGGRKSIGFYVVVALTSCVTTH